MSTTNRPKKGEPTCSVSYKDGARTEAWRIKDVLHREDGPAHVYIRPDGAKIEGWYQNGELHREDGPAIVTFLGDGTVLTERWCRNGVEVDPPQKKRDAQTRLLAERTARTTLTVPASLHVRLKVMAAEQGVSLQRLIHQILSEGIEQRPRVDLADNLLIHGNFRKADQDQKDHRQARRPGSARNVSKRRTLRGRSEG